MRVVDFGSFAVLGDNVTQTVADSHHRLVVFKIKHGRIFKPHRDRYYISFKLVMTKPRHARVFEERLKELIRKMR
jgi:hypothetical protein